MRIWRIIHLSLIILLLISCNNSAKVQKGNNNREITDMANRNVIIPDTVERVICIRPGSMTRFNGWRHKLYIGY